MDFTGGIGGLGESLETDNVKNVENAEFASVEKSTAVSTDTSLGELRWEGMTNAQLAAAVQQLNSGTGAAAMTEAADALANVAADLTTIDSALQTQMLAIGVNWQSQSASDLADQMLAASSAYGGTVTEQGGQSSTAINQQAEAYAAARNAAPKPQALAGNTTPSTGSSPFTGHGNDRAQQVSQTNAARDQAVDAMNNYTSASQSNLGGYQPPAPPPAIGLNPQPSGGTSTSGYTGPSGSGSGGGTPPVLGGGSGGGVGTLPPGVPSGSGGGGLPGMPGSTGPVSGIGAPTGIGAPGGGAGGFSTGVPGGFPGGGFAGGTPGPGSIAGGGSGTTGPISGIGPNTGSGPISRAAGMPSSVAAGAGGEIGEIAAGAAVAGGTAAVGIVGANAGKRGEDEELAPRGNNEPGGFADDDEDDFNPNRSALAELDEDQAAAARMNAQLSASEPAAPGVLEPALGRRDDDAEHRNSYAGKDDDFFDDGRMVIPDVLGGRVNDDEQDA